MIDDEVVNMLKGQQTEEQRYIIHLENKLSWQCKRLTKAKEIIEKLVSQNRKLWVYSDIREQAEQFLKEVDE